MIDIRIRKEIMSRLHAAEKEHDIWVLYACESGSRALGFGRSDLSAEYEIRDALNKIFRAAA